MAIGSQAWNDELFYILARCETNLTWGSVEKGARKGCGILGWSFENAAALLQYYISNFPSHTQHLDANFISLIQAGWSYPDHTFNDSEAQQIVNALGSADGIQAQKDYWLIDNPSNPVCLPAYLRLVGQGSWADEKAAIMWISCRHHRPASSNSVMLATGTGVTLEQMKNAILQNSFFGGRQAFINRYNNVYNWLNEWDGVTSPDITGFDYDNIGDGTDADGLEPSLVESNYNLNYIEQKGDNLICYFGNDQKVYCYRSTNALLWLPYEKEQSSKPEQNSNSNTFTPPQTIGGTGGQKILNMARTIPDGTLTYTQDIPARMNIIGGYADCSSFTWWTHNQLGLSIPTNTYGLWKDEENVISEIFDSVASLRAACQSGLYVTGDLIVWRDNRDGSGNGHVEIFDYENQDTFGVHDRGAVNPSYSGGIFMSHRYAKIVRYWNKLQT